MEIQYLKNLESNPVKWPSSDLINTPMPLSEIEQLEQLYNAGVPFPKALRELLFLAGKYCWVMGGDAAEEQLYIRAEMQEFGTTIPQPFFVVFVREETFGFVYLDEGDDPTYRIVDDYTEPATVGGTTPGLRLGQTDTLSQEIERRILMIRDYNPDPEG